VQFVHHDLGQQSAGATAVVKLSGTEANVYLMDAHSFSSFRSTRRASQAYGGHYRGSPVRLTVPRAGHWHVAVYITPGYVGRVISSAYVIPPVAAAA
jgi:hypothetical protein